MLLKIYDWSQYLGVYPHAHMNPAGRKKQTTRLIKAVCLTGPVNASFDMEIQGCGYTIRTTQKWIDARGAPLCPCNAKRMTVESAESEEDSE